MRMMWRHMWQRLRGVSGPQPFSAEPAASAVDSRYCGLHDAVLSGWFNNATGELHPGFAVGPHDTVLDFGCGAGGATQFCARQGARVIFADSDASKITQLETALTQSGASSFQGIVSDALPLPLANACVNRVVAQEVLEHVEDPQQTLAELYRLGQPGALYLLSVPHARSELLQQGIAPASHFAPPNHRHIFDEAQFMELVQSSGLQVISRHDFGFYWAFWMMLYWTNLEAEGSMHQGATHDLIAPPYAPLLDDWAAIWQRLLHMPAGPELKRRLDALLPKSQIIVARKPFD